MNFKFFLQKLGKSVLFPIAALPVAGLLIRFGADDMLNIPLLGAAGTIFANMDMLFALSIVIGFSTVCIYKCQLCSFRKFGSSR